MYIKILNNNFSICKIKDIKSVDFTDEYYFLGKTDEEISLVCSTACVPQSTIERDDGWRAFRIEGLLDFSLVGILAKISGILAAESISIFAVSTYNTDYILVKEDSYQKAISLLEKNEYKIIEN